MKNELAIERLLELLLSYQMQALRESFSILRICFLIGIDVGLFAYTFHPDVLGESMAWISAGYGIFGMMLASILLGYEPPRDQKFSSHVIDDLKLFSCIQKTKLDELSSKFQENGCGYVTTSELSSFIIGETHRLILDGKNISS